MIAIACPLLTPGAAAAVDLGGRIQVVAVDAVRADDVLHLASRRPAAPSARRALRVLSCATSDAVARNGASACAITRYVRPR